MEIISLKEDASSAKPTSSAKPSNSANAQIITAMKPAVKNENRVNIYVNNKYEFSLDLTQVVDYKIKVGTILSPEKIAELKHASELGKLYQRTLEWILTRPHSAKETRDYLIRKRMKRESENRQALRNRTRSKDDIKKYHLHTKELPLFSEADIEKIILRLSERDYINDYAFTKYYLENRNVKKGISLKKLKLELAKKGIDRTLIEKVLSEENPRSDEEEIKKIIKKKRQRYDDEKLIQYLARQGFDYQLAKSLVQGYQEQD